MRRASDTTKQRMGRGRRALAAAVLLGTAFGAVGTGGTASADTNWLGPLPPEPTRGDACGRYIPKSESYRYTTAWSCVVAENFTGTGLNRDLWSVQSTKGSGFGVGGECFVDDPDNVSVSNGTLKLTARKEATPFLCESPHGNFTTQYTAGSIFTNPAYDQTYGRFEIKARMPASTVPGLHFAFWLWPRDLTNYPITAETGRWANGEIDVMEWYSLYPQHGVPFLHYAHKFVQTSTGKWVPADQNLTKACLVGTMSDWHTYTLEWTPRAIRIFYDGNLCLENTSWDPTNTTKPGPFDKPFMTSLTQALGYSKGATPAENANQVTAATPLPATAEVEYLKIWR